MMVSFSRNQSAAPRRASRGFVLIEALVAMLIFAFGVLGIVGLQAAMTKAQTSSKFRADAAFLAQQLVGTMWSDTPHLTSYATASCASYARCDQWADKVAAELPSGTAAITVNGAAVQIAVSWTPPNEETHTYTTTAAIAANVP